MTGIQKVSAITIAILLSVSIGYSGPQAGASAGAPSDITASRVIKFGGVLKDHTGKALSGVQGVAFALYKDQQGGSPLWLEAQNLQFDEQGNYSVLLGVTRSEGLPIELFITGESRWLGVQAQVAGEEEQPRVLLVGVPYALKAADADTLGGKPPSAYLLAPSAVVNGSSTNGENVKNINVSVSADTGNAPGSLAMFAGDGTTLLSSNVTQSNGNIGIGTTNPGAPLTVNGTARLTNDLDLTRRFDNFTDASLVVDNVITTGFNFQKLGGGAVNNIRFIGNTLYASGNFGIGTPTPGARLTVNGISQLANDLDLTRRFDNFTDASLVVDNVITTAFNFQRLGGGNVNNIRFLGNTLYASGNLGVGIPTPSQKLDVAGNANVSGGLTSGGSVSATGTVSGSQLTSTVGSGISPLVVNSTTQVPNLNASYLGGMSSDAARTRIITYLGGCDNCSILTGSDNQPMIYVNQLGAMTINSVTCFSDFGTPTINIARAGTNILGAGLQCAPTGPNNINSSPSPNSMALNDTLDFVMVTPGTTTHRVTVVIKATVNPVN